MGQKVSPNGLRIGINKDWQSRWCVKNDKTYADWLHSDIKIRNVIFKNWKHAAISRIEIERSKVASKDHYTKVKIQIFIYTARPGVILGQEGSNIEVIIKSIRKSLKDRKNDINITVVEVKNPDVDAQLVANTMAQQIVNRASFRNIQKLAIRKALKAGAKGVKTLISGRLGGVEMARSEGYSEGIVPLSTLRNDIDFAEATALTTYGIIGIKVWICKGEILPEKKKQEVK